MGDVVEDQGEAPGTDDQPLDATGDAGREPVDGDGWPIARPTLSGPAEEGTDVGASPFPVLAESSLNPAVCPFLRSATDDGPGPPFVSPDPRNRCAAIGEPAPQSGRQQELVCLTRGHSNCPRYLRGAMVLGEPAGARVNANGPSAAVLGAAVALAVAASLSVGFLLVRGGFDLALASPSPNPVAIVDPSPGPTSPGVAQTPSTSPAATPSPTPTESPMPSPTPSPTSIPTVAASPTPPVTPTVTPKPTAAPTSNRYAYLKPCPSGPDCWVYTVRSGDNLQSIVNWFGVPYATVIRMNPQISDPTQIRAGDMVRMPPPTR
jgi:hypothetical protein